MDTTQGTYGFPSEAALIANWSIIDTHGPDDDSPVRDQSVTLEESESDEPDASLTDDEVQDVKP